MTIGNQMEMVVMGWFILTLTDSPFLVGLIAAARMSLNLMALFAGAIAHRFPRHRILAGAEFVLAAISVAMLALLLTGRLETWHIFMLAVLGGMIGVFQMPSSQLCSLTHCRPTASVMARHSTLWAGPLVC